MHSWGKLPTIRYKKIKCQVEELGTKAGPVLAPFTQHHQGGGQTTQATPPHHMGFVDHNIMSFLSKEILVTPFCCWFQLKHPPVTPPPLTSSPSNSLFQVANGAECSPWSDQWEGDRHIPCIRDK